MQTLAYLVKPFMIHKLLCENKTKWWLLRKQGVAGQMAKGIFSYLKVLNRILEYFKVITGHPVYIKVRFINEVEPFHNIRAVDLNNS